VIVPLPAASRLAPVLAVAAAVGALLEPLTGSNDRQFASAVSLVEVYATVSDPKGEPVTGLGPADFTIEEDGQPQAITAFAAGEFPLAVAVGLDHSFSMTPDQLARAVAAARRFIAALRPGDRLMIVGIGSETEVLAPLSADHDRALSALDQLEAWGTTPLYDATLAAIEAVQAGSGRRALLLLSDGADRYSRTAAADLVEHARRSDVLVYPVTLGRTRPPVLFDLARVTGGRASHVTSPRQLPGLLEGIARELRLQYLIGYTPAREADASPRWRSIRVSTSRPGVRIRARDGYFSR
jgi:Ca-activated chloride channel family protein